MNFEPLGIDGAYKITPNKIGDDRGAFARVYCDQEFAKRGLNVNWVQMNQSISAQKGTVRGLHFQHPPFAEVKLVRCITGAIFDVFLDMREGSPTYGRICSVTLSGEAMESVYIPAGCAHGFQTLTHDVQLHYCHSAPYEPSAEGAVNAMDATLAIQWPLPVAIMSERDKDHPNFSNLKAISL